MIRVFISSLVFALIVFTAFVMAQNNASYNVSSQAMATAPLTGTSTTQNPGVMLAGACNTFTIIVTGATTSQTASVSAIGGVTLGATISLTANVTSANTVTVNECAIIGVTPASAVFRAVVQ